MTEGERAQERPQRGRRPSALEQPAHRAVPQQIGPIDRVRPGDHRPDQRRDLQLRVHAALARQRQMLGDQLGQSAPLGQRQHQPRTRHQIRVIEQRVFDMADSHPTDALQLGRICP